MMCKCANVCKKGSCTSNLMKSLREEAVVQVCKGIKGDTKFLNGGRSRRSNDLQAHKNILIPSSPLHSCTTGVFSNNHNELSVQKVKLHTFAHLHIVRDIPCFG